MGPLLREWQVAFEECKLPIGSVIWVVQNATEKELLLPYVHHQYDRFAHSIKNGDLHDLKVILAMF